MKDNELKSVEDFHKAFDHPVRSTDKKELVTHSDYQLRKRLVVEEANEALEAIAQADLVELADGCADTIYVLAGSVLHLARRQDANLDHAAQLLLIEGIERFTNAMEMPEKFNVDTAISFLEIVIRGVANTYDIPLDKVFDEVHRSNMTKLHPDGSVKKDEGGKVIKPKSYSPANIEGILYAKAG